MGACCSHRAQRLCAGGDEMKLSPWFHVGKYGAPVNLGWYDFELWITPDHEVLCSVLHIRAEYVGNMFITLRNGRRVQLTYDDFWRGVEK